MINDSVFLVFVLGTIVVSMFTVSLILFIIQHKKKVRLHDLETGYLKQEYQAHLLQTRLEVQEQSLQYFSEEIHDNISQVLALVKLNFYELGQMDVSIAAKEIIDQSTHYLGRAISDLRSISHRLNGELISSEGLDKALKKELGFINLSRSVMASIHISGEPYSLGSERELLIFRILQEGIANVIKHSGARNLEVTLYYTDTHFSALIHDDGKGFDPSRAVDGLGLITMRSRVALLKGDLQISSQPNGGNDLKLQISSRDTKEQ